MPQAKRHRRMVFARRETVADGRGNFDGAWEDQFTVLAHVVPLKGGEEVIASRLAGVQPVIIRVLASDNTRLVGTHWRATDALSGEVYNIQSKADMTQARHEIDFLAASGVPV